MPCKETKDCWLLIYCRQRWRGGGAGSSTSSRGVKVNEGYLFGSKGEEGKNDEECKQYLDLSYFDENGDEQSENYDPRNEFVNSRTTKVVDLTEDKRIITTIPFFLCQIHHFGRSRVNEFILLSFIGLPVDELAAPQRKKGTYVGPTESPVQYPGLHFP